MIGRVLQMGISTNSKTHGKPMSSQPTGILSIGKRLRLIINKKIVY